jgi:hypothetical protein
MPEEQPSKSSAVWIAVVLLIAAGSFYVLSAGPAYWLFEHRYINHAWLPTVYRPVHFGMERSPLFRRFMWSYLELWDKSMRYRSDDPFS